MFDSFHYICALLFGLCIGSFLNVVILRVPLNQEFVKTPSHCMKCGHKLSWYDNIPLVSWLMLRGKCRYCKAPISKQYPIIEALNGILWMLSFIMLGVSLNTLIICGMISVCIALGVIDFRTHEIPDGFHFFLLALGILMILLNMKKWPLYIIGFFAVSIVLALIYWISGGTAIGGGDVKLMAVLGLIVGWKHIVLGFVIGCIVGSVIHIIRMKLTDCGRELAFGPYLGGGVIFSVLFCQPLINWYLGTF